MSVPGIRHAFDVESSGNARCIPRAFPLLYLRSVNVALERTVTFVDGSLSNTHSPAALVNVGLGGIEKAEMSVLPSLGL